MALIEKEKERERALVITFHAERVLKPRSLWCNQKRDEVGLTVYLLLNFTQIDNQSSRVESCCNGAHPGILRETRSTSVPPSLTPFAQPKRKAGFFG